MEVCSNFTADSWRPKKCKNCFQPKDQHSNLALDENKNDSNSVLPSPIKPKSLVTPPVEPKPPVPPPPKPRTPVVSRPNTPTKVTSNNSDNTAVITNSSEPSTISCDESTTTVPQNPPPINDHNNISLTSNYLQSQDQINNSTNIIQSIINIQANFTGSSRISDEGEGDPSDPSYPVHSDQNVTNDTSDTEGTTNQPEKQPSPIEIGDVSTSISVTNQNLSFKKPACKYADRCYRKNPEHLAAFSHPNEIQHGTDSTRVSQTSSSLQIPCLYGNQCYRKNPVHRAKYSHLNQTNIPSVLHQRKVENEEFVREREKTETALQKLEEDLKRQKAEIEAARKKMEQELQEKEAALEKARKKMEEDLAQKQAKIETDREKTENELKKQREAMEISRRKAEEDLQRQKDEITAKHKKTEEELQAKRTKVQRECQETREDLQQQKQQIEIAQKKMDEDMQKQTMYVMIEQKRIQMRLKQIEKQSCVSIEEKKALEQSIEKLQEEKRKIETDRRLLEKALATELEERERADINMQRIIQIKRDVPNYWGINAFDEPYREIDISPTSNEFQIIQSLLNETIETHDNKFGTIYKKDPTEFIATQIIRIHNKHLWQHYCYTKENIIAKNKHQLINCESSMYLKDRPLLMPLLDAKANEYWLFHGCDAMIIPILLQSGYDPRVSSLDGMFGGGFYLAENSSKSNQYIPCPGCGKNAIFRGIGCSCKQQEKLEFFIILYRAVLGDVHVAKVYDEKMYRGEEKCRVRRPPFKNKSVDLYDSVMGESKTHSANNLKYREFILYECNQAYPEYVIRFRRSATNARPPSNIERMKDRCQFFLKNTFSKKKE